MQTGNRLRTVIARPHSGRRRAPEQWGDATGVGITATENVLADRREAGRLLAERLTPLGDDSPVVLALPCGGVPVGAEIADALGARLDVILVGPLSPPHRPASAFGFIGEGGIRLLDIDAIDRAGVTGEDIAHLESDVEADLMRQSALYRIGRKPVPIEGRTVIVVVDGLDNEARVRATVRLARERRARRVILAIPVAPRAALHRLQAVADDVVSLIMPTYLVAVGLWYRDFPHTSDDEVVDILRANSDGTDPSPCPEPAPGTHRLADC